MQKKQIVRHGLTVISLLAFLVLAIGSYDSSTTTSTSSSTASSTTSSSGSSSSLPIGQRNALQKANQYLATMPFSKKGLVTQLEYEGFSNSDSTYAVDNCSANWNEQAAKKAKSYLDTMSFSRSGLVDQLVYDGFTSSEAEYGVKSVGY